MKNPLFASRASSIMQRVHTLSNKPYGNSCAGDVLEKQLCRQAGTIDRNKQTQLSQAQSAIAIGAEYGGGIVFYVDGTGKHGLVAAKADMQGSSSGDGDGGFTWCDAEAACNALVSNGYCDWFLPNKEQLCQLYLNKSAVGGFTGNNYYWSSSEYSSDIAWAQNFSNGTQYVISKSSDIDLVRAVRAF